MKRLLNPIFFLSLSGIILLCSHWGGAIIPQQDKDPEIRPRVISTRDADLEALIEHAHNGNYQQVVDKLLGIEKLENVSNIFTEYIKDYVAVNNCINIFTLYSEKLIKRQLLPWHKKLADDFSSKIFNKMVLQAAIDGKDTHLRYLLASKEGKKHVSSNDLSNVYEKLPQRERSYNTHQCKNLIVQEYKERLAQAKLEAGIISYVNCPCLFFYDFILTNRMD